MQCTAATKPCAKKRYNFRQGSLEIGNKLVSIDFTIYKHSLQSINTFNIVLFK